MILEFTRWGTAEREFAGKFMGVIFLWIVFFASEQQSTLDKVSVLPLDYVDCFSRIKPKN